MFGGSCIGVISLVLCLEFLRRVGREYDAFILRRSRLRRQYLSVPQSVVTQNSNSPGAPGNDTNTSKLDPETHAIASPTAANASPPVAAAAPPPLIRPTFVEQVVRAALHTMQFAVAYFVMLLAMYFNGYIIICIFIGAFLGAFMFSWEPLGSHESE